MGYANVMDLTDPAIRNIESIRQAVDIFFAHPTHNSQISETLFNEHVSHKSLRCCQFTLPLAN